MPMKISLALGPRQPLSGQTAWGCLTTNLMLPGAGSLMAGRVSGYGQLALATGGLALTALFGLRFILWYLANWRSFNQPQADPLEGLSQMWLVLRWPLLGIGIFLAGWLWALVTSIQIIRSARKAEQGNVPPRLG